MKIQTFSISFKFFGKIQNSQSVNLIIKTLLMVKNIYDLFKSGSLFL